MKFCPNCTAPIDDDAEVCIYCGSKVERTHSHPDCDNAIEPELNDGGNCEDEQTNELPNQEATEAISDNQETIPALDTQYNEQLREENTDNNRLLKIVGIVLAIIAAIVIIYFLSTSTKNKSDEISLESELQDNFGNIEESSLIDSVDYDTVVESTPDCRFFGDGATFDVRGHVKSVNNTHFDKDGFIIPETEWTTITRNEKGQIVEIDPNDPGFHPIYKYNSDGRVIQMKDLNECEPFVICNYIYDSEGFVSAITKDEEFIEGDYIEFENPKTFTATKTVKVLEVDSHNNWTKRRISGEEIVLDGEGDEYAGMNGSTDSPLYYVKKNIEIVEARKIEYYE